MSSKNLPENLRLLCSYGRSVSEICRRIGLNRQQFNKYLTGQTQPSLATLRRICDFFGVDEGEILQNHAAFSKLVRLRPPVLPRSSDPQADMLAKIFRHDRQNEEVLERHAGYYHIYMSPDPTRNYLLKSAGHMFKLGRGWFTKELERYEQNEFAVPSPLRHSGMLFEAHNRLFITSREQGRGYGIWSTVLIASDYDEPSFLPGLLQGIEPEGGHLAYATRVVWEYLGKTPDLRKVVEGCGVLKGNQPGIPEFVRNALLSPDGNQQPTLTATF